jgi:hypothetical protein
MSSNNKRELEPEDLGTPRKRRNIDADVAQTPFRGAARSSIAGSRSRAQPYNSANSRRRMFAARVQQGEREASGSMPVAAEFSFAPAPSVASHEAGGLGKDEQALLDNFLSSLGAGEDRRSAVLQIVQRQGSAGDDLLLHGLAAWWGFSLIDAQMGVQGGRSLKDALQELRHFGSSERYVPFGRYND